MGRSGLLRNCVQDVEDVLILDSQDVRDLACLVPFLGQEADHGRLGSEGGQFLLTFDGERHLVVGSLGLEGGEDVDGFGGLGLFVVGHRMFLCVCVELLFQFSLLISFLIVFII